MDTSLVLNIQLQGDVGLAKQYIPEARVLAASLVERLHLGGVESGSAQRIITDDVIAYAVVAMKTASVIIIAGGDVVVDDYKIEASYIPDFYSGVVAGGNIVSDGYLDKYYPTRETCRKYDLPESWLKPSKLAVKPYLASDTKIDPERFGDPFNPDTENTNIDLGSDFMQETVKATEEFPNPSQYTNLKPTYYTGTMRSVVQALMGFGFNTRTPYRLIEEEDGRKQFYPFYERQVRKNGRQIRYDYRWVRTHGITKASDGKLWLVEISMARGVLAMPLAIIARTDSEKFMNLLENLSDVDAIRMVEDFGGFPSGEAFPSVTAVIDAAVKAGRVLKLAPSASLNDFYQKSFYSSAMGWAFSENGSQAANTCNTTNEENGQMMGYYYTIDISIGVSRDIDPPPQKESLLELLAGETFQFPEEVDALAFKIDLMTEREAISVLRASDPLQALRDLTVTPLTSGSAKMTKGGEGYLWTAPTRTARSYLKFWEPAADGAVLSFMMKPDIEIWDQKVRDCDTPVFVFYEGSALHKCNFFTTSKAGPAKQDADPPEECMYVGTWTFTSSGGGGRTMGNFYTSRIDTRKEAFPNTVTSKLTGSKAGIVEVRIGDYPTDIRRGKVDRTAGFIFTSETTVTDGYSLQNALVIPGWDRESYYYATMESSVSGSKSITVGGKYLNDPYWGEYYRTMTPGKPGYFGMAHPLCSDSQTTRRIEYLHYDPYTCSEYAEYGQWLEECQNIDLGSAYNNPIPSSSSSTERDYEGKVSVSFYSSGTGIIETVKDAEVLLRWTPLWWVNSPDEGGNLQWIFATQSCFGDSEAYRIDAKLNTLMDDVLMKGGRFTGEQFKQSITYIGVV